MKEMARVCDINGAISIVSYLHAWYKRGVEWLENVVIQGLRDEWAERRKRNKVEKMDGDHDSEEMEAA